MGKKQHYVPQFYLKSFSTLERKDAVYVLKKSSVKVFGPVMVKEVAHENAFYDHEANSYDVEDALAKFETKAADVHRLILETQALPPPNSNARDIYARFLALQMRRTRKARWETELRGEIVAAKYGAETPSDATRASILEVGLPVLDGNERLAVGVIEDVLQTTDVSHLGSKEDVRQIALKIVHDTIRQFRNSVERGELTPELKDHLRAFPGDEHEVKRHHLSTLDRATKLFKQILLQMDWMLLQNSSDVPLVTSDSPVLLFDRNKFMLPESTVDELIGVFSLIGNFMGDVNWLTDTGALSPHIQLVFPVSPALLLSLSPPGSPNFSSPNLNDADHARGFNKLHLYQAYDFVFASSDQLGELIPDVELANTMSRIIHWSRDVSKRDR